MKKKPIRLRQPIVVDAEGVIICGHTREQRNTCVHVQRRGIPPGHRYFRAIGGQVPGPAVRVLLHVQPVNSKVK